MNTFLNFKYDSRSSFEAFRQKYTVNSSGFVQEYADFYQMKYSPEKQLLKSKIEKAVHSHNITMNDVEYFLNTNMITWPEYTLNVESISLIRQYLNKFETKEDKEMELKVLEDMWKQYNLYAYVSSIDSPTIDVSNDLIYLYAHMPFSVQTYEYTDIKIEVHNDYDYVRCGGPERKMHHVPHSHKADYYLLFISRENTLYEIKGSPNVVGVITGTTHPLCDGPEVFILRHNMTKSQAQEFLKSTSDGGLE